MMSRQFWVDDIRRTRGKVSATGDKNHRHPLLTNRFGERYTWIDAYWVYSKPGDDILKDVRDKFARNLRYDGWDVTTGQTANRLEYYLFAKRRRE